MPRYEEDFEAGRVTFTAPYYDIAGLLREVATYIENRVSLVADLDIRLGDPVPGEEHRDLFRNQAILWVDAWDEE